MDKWTMPFMSVHFSESRNAENSTHCGFRCTCGQVDIAHPSVKLYPSCLCLRWLCSVCQRDDPVVQREINCNLIVMGVNRHQSAAVKRVICNEGHARRNIHLCHWHILKGLLLNPLQVRGQVIPRYPAVYNPRLSSSCYNEYTLCSKTLIQIVKVVSFFPTVIFDCHRFCTTSDCKS